jgi:hypothetical protein
MKTKFKLTIFSLSLAVLLTIGCKKDSSGPSTKMAAKIDGKAWNTTFRETFKNNEGFVITGQQLNSSIITSSLVIRIKGFTKGTYDALIINSASTAVYTPNIQELTKSFTSISGTVEITEVNTNDKTISGTFNFTCTNLSVPLVTMSITDGSFNDLLYIETSGS